LRGRKGISGETTIFKETKRKDRRIFDFLDSPKGAGREESEAES